MVTVTAGANQADLDGLAGQTVGAVRAAFSGIYNISDAAVATVNGVRAAEGQILAAGDDLRFLTELAEKGA